MLPITLYFKRQTSVWPYQQSESKGWDIDDFSFVALPIPVVGYIIFYKHSLERYV